MSIAFLATPLKPKQQGTKPGAVYITRSAFCGGPAFALGGGSLFCLRCLRPYIAAGERFQPSINVRRQGVA